MEKKTLPHHVGKAGGLGDSLVSSQRHMPHHTLEWLDDSWVSRITLLTWSSGGSNHSEHSWGGPMTIIWMHIFLTWVCPEGLQCCKPQWLSPPLVKITSSIAPKSRKHPPEQTPTYISKLVGGQLWKRNFPVEDPWHNWHMPQEHLGLRMLLWHSDEDNNTSFIPQLQWWWQNHIMLFPCCW